MLGILLRFLIILIPTSGVPQHSIPVLAPTLVQHPLTVAYSHGTSQLPVTSASSGRTSALERRPAAIRAGRLRGQHAIKAPASELVQPGRWREAEVKHGAVDRDEPWISEGVRAWMSLGAVLLGAVAASVTGRWWLTRRGAAEAKRRAISVPLAVSPSANLLQMAMLDGRRLAHTATGSCGSPCQQKLAVAAVTGEERPVLDPVRTALPEAPRDIGEWKLAEARLRETMEALNRPSEMDTTAADVPSTSDFTCGNSSLVAMLDLLASVDPLPTRIDRGMLIGEYKLEWTNDLPPSVRKELPDDATDAVRELSATLSISDDGAMVTTAFIPLPDGETKVVTLRNKFDDFDGGSCFTARNGYGDRVSVEIAYISDDFLVLRRDSGNCNAQGQKLASKGLFQAKTDVWRKMDHSSVDAQSQCGRASVSPFGLPYSIPFFGKSRSVFDSWPLSNGARKTSHLVARALAGEVVDKNSPSEGFFDPLGFGADDYISKVMENHGVPFDKMRWYEESELMHGRVAMLAMFNLILRETPFTGFMPASPMEQAAAQDFMKFMVFLEGVRGWRLLVDQDMIAGDLGLGMGTKASALGFKNEITEQELAKKRSKELVNGRLAMIACAGVAGQYAFTGRGVGLTAEQMLSLESALRWEMYADDNILRSIVLSALGVVMLVDGFKRISESGDETRATNPIAAQAINPLKLSAGVQQPGVPLPGGVVAGQEPQRLSITEEQVVMFEEDGVIMIRGAMADWVGFLRAITEHQIEHPHLWSLVGRMSGLYDYIQRNMWMTNDGFRDFLYYSPLGHILSQLGRTEEVRVTTDMLLCNPNKGFGWHQDNQNGPIDFPDAMRWWVAMDRCGQDDFGAPEYLLGSHRNHGVSGDAVFVNLEDGDLPNFTRTSTFVAEPGDLIIWNARTIHRILAPPGQRWDQGTQRRAIGGTVAKKGAVYRNKGGASGISDLAGHDQKDGELLSSPYFPRIFPSRDPHEEEVRARQEIIGRSPRKIADLAVTLASNAGKYVSFTKVVGRKT